ncbi:MAG: hypothetical protein HKO93_04260, partial [Flavobacteriales bacterium]|nr:hypothetical protein [Flavobacteriales bacterium]
MAIRKSQTKKKGISKKKSAKKANPLNGLKDAINSRKTRRVFGLFLCIVSVLVSVAYISYLFTWQEDQSLLMGDISDLFADKQIRVKNWLGKIGASISHASFYNGFGISSFIFPFLLSLFGLKAISRKYILPIWKTLAISLFSLFWVSLFFGVFFSDTLHLGGRVGYEAKLWGDSIFGRIGTISVIAFTLLSFILVVFNPGFQWVNAVAEKMATLFQRDDIEEAVSTNTEISPDPIPENPSEAIPLPVSEKDLEIEDEVLNNILSDDDEGVEQMETKEATTRTEHSGSNDEAEDEDFSIEMAPEEHLLSEKEVNKKV